MDPAAVATGDLVQTITWLGKDAGVKVNLDSFVHELAGGSLRLDTAEGARTLQRYITVCRLPIVWTELRLRDLGRHRSAVVADPRTGAVLYIQALRWARHKVRIVLDGHVSTHLLSTPRLAKLLGCAPSSSVTALAASPRLPLEPLRKAGASPWARARLLLGLDRADIRLAFVYGGAIGVLSLATPIAVQALVNTIALGALLQPLLVLTVLVAVVLTFAGVVRVLQAHVVEAIQVRMFVRTTADVSRRLFDCPPVAHGRASPAQLTARFLEVPVLQKAVAILLVDGIDLLLKLVVGIALLTVYHPILLLFALSLVGSLLLVTFIGGRGAIATALDESYAKYAIVGWFERAVHYAGGPRSIGGRQRAVERVDHLTRRYRDARRAHFRKLLRHLAGGIAIKVVGGAALLGIGGALVVAGQLTLGQLVAAELIFASIAIALVKLHKQLEAVYDLVASSVKLAELVEVPTERRGGEHLTGNGAMSVKLVGASIGHDAASPLVRDLDLTIAAGERVAIMGAGACGKSTLVDALATLHPLAKGVIAFDELDLRQLALAELRGQLVCMREGETELAPDSIEENLRMVRPYVTLGQIEEALGTVYLSATVGALPDGLSTHLTRSGRPLSASATRRLAIARALLAVPRLWLVDGGFDDLGLGNDHKQLLLDKLFAGRNRTTIVVVTDDPDVLGRCDRIIRIEHGGIEALR